MTFPAVITTARDQLVCDMLAQFGWDASEETGYPLSPGSEIHDNPDKIVFITGTGGPGYLTEEGGVDGESFQARTRGPADDPIAAKIAAQTLDWLILAGPYPVLVDGVRVLNCQRLGSPPAALPLDEADKRFEFTATYIIVTGA